jgi:hypothetical protein
MNTKALILGVVFLIAALIVPVFALYESATSTLRGISEIPNLADQTQLTTFYNQQAAQQQTLMFIVIVLEVILVSAFAISLVYALRCTNRDQCRNFAPP